MRFLKCHLSLSFSSLLIPKRALFKAPGQEAPKDDESTKGPSSADNIAVEQFMTMVESRMNEISDTAENADLKLRVLYGLKRDALDGRESLKNASEVAKIKAAEEVQALFDRYQKTFDNLNSGVSAFVKAKIFVDQAENGMNNIQRDLVKNVFGMPEPPSGIQLANAEKSESAAQKKQKEVTTAVNVLENLVFSLPASNETAKFTKMRLLRLQMDMAKKSKKSGQLVTAAERFIHGSRLKTENASLVQDPTNTDPLKTPKNTNDRQVVADAHAKLDIAEREIGYAKWVYQYVTGDVRRFHLPANMAYQTDPIMFGPREDKAKKEYGIKQLPAVSSEQASAVEKMNPGDSIKLKVMTGDVPTEVEVKKEENGEWVLVESDKKFGQADDLLFDVSLFVAQKNSLIKKQTVAGGIVRKEIKPQDKQPVQSP